MSFKHLWNVSQLLANMSMVIIGITTISMCSADNANSNPPLARHQHDQRSDVEGDDGNNIIYECPDANHSEELQAFMTELGNEPGESTERIYSDGKGSRKSMTLNQVEDCASMKPSIDSGTLWSPSDKLFGIKEPETRTRFRLCRKLFSCPNDRIVKVFHWHPYWDDQQKFRQSSIQKPAPFQLSNMTLIKGGYLVWNREKYERHVYTKEEYCISRRGQGGWLSFKVCASNCSSSPCVRKCCSLSEVIGAETKKCIPVHPPWRPIFYKSADEQDNYSDSVVPNTSIIEGFPPCQKKYMIHATTPLDHFKLLLNGTLVRIIGSRQIPINVGEFCIDGIQYEENNYELGNEMPMKYSNSEWDQVVIACVPNATKKWRMDFWRVPLFSTLNCISTLFLLLTDIVILVLWRHQNIHEWLKFCFATSLFCTFSSFVVVQLWSYELFNISKFLCKIMGYTNHLTHLSAFFWLTSMNFDLWWRFSRLLPNSGMSRPQEKNVKRFLRFGAFSIGIFLC